MARDDLEDDTMNCGLSVAEHERLHARLCELPDTMPPRAVWNRIAEQARAEGLWSRSRAHLGVKWAVGAALAAAVALIVLRVPISESPQHDAAQFRTEPSLAEVSENTGLRGVNALMVQSRQLENDLRSLPAQPRLVRAGTVATISELEDRIAEIDYWLNHPDVRLSPQLAEGYWRERVRLMNSLVQLRYAQAQRVSF
jgi:hypothetical protein